MPDVTDRKPKKTLLIAIVVAIALFVYVASVDPFREVRRLHPIQSWNKESLVDRTMPEDIVVFDTIRSRAFRFSQDPVEVFTGLGGDASELLRVLKRDAEPSKDSKFETIDFMQMFGLPLTLKSGREGDFFILKGDSQYTCKLVIRPLKKFEVRSIFDWVSR